MIRQAEASKAKIYGTPGNNPNYGNFETPPEPFITHLSSLACDESYVMIGSHVDQVLEDKMK